jgi:mRNA interferase RelE/StbE
MAWNVELAPEAKAQLNKLGTAEARRILGFLHERLRIREDPREIGKALKGVLKAYWRYRVGDYRIICRIEDKRMTVLVVQIDHRSVVYKRK